MRGRKRVTDRRILVWEPQAIVREGLCLLLQKVPRVRVVVASGTGGLEEILRLIRKHHPTHLVGDFGESCQEAAAACRRFIQERPGLKVLALCNGKDGNAIQRMMRIGANGYVSKEAAPSELIRAFESGLCT